MEKMEAELEQARANAESYRSQLEEAQTAGPGQVAATASPTPTTSAPENVAVLSDATRIGEFTWADLREAAMQPGYLQMSSFVSPLSLYCNSTLSYASIIGKT